jgi:hypothetical protein
VVGHPRALHRTSIEAGHGAVWAASHDVENDSVRIERIDPETGLIEAACDVDGRPQPGIPNPLEVGRGGVLQVRDAPGVVFGRRARLGGRRRTV